MAVIIQQVVGAIHGERFYPDFSGVARSQNFYPVAPMTAADGVAAVALGLGRRGRGKGLTFCPRYPERPGQFSTVETSGQLANQSGPWNSITKPVAAASF